MSLKFPDILQHNNPNYPLIDDNQLKGGCMTVADKTARNAIPIEKRKIGMSVSWIETAVSVIKYYDGADVTDPNWTNDGNWKIIGNADYAPIAKGVTNGDSHDHTGGAGAQIDHEDLSSIENTSPKHVKAIGYAGTFVDPDAPTEAELEAILGTPDTYPSDKVILIDATNIGGSGSLYIIATEGSYYKHIRLSDESSLLYALASQGVTNGNSHDHTGGAGAQIDHEDLSSIENTSPKHVKVIGYAGTFVDADNPSEAELEAILGLPSDYPSAKVFLIDADNIGASGTYYFVGCNGDNYKFIRLTDAGGTQIYALVANGVTNGNSHNHTGGAGAQINHTTLSNIGTVNHASIDAHISPTKPNKHVIYGEGTLSTTPTLAQLQVIFGNAETYDTATVLVALGTGGTGAGKAFLVVPNGQDPGDYHFIALTKAI